MRKNVLSFTLLFALLLLVIPRFSFATPPAGPEFLKTGIYLKNNTFLPKKVTVVSYGPFQANHTTEVFTLLPGQKVHRKYLMGTKLYLANKDDMVMLKEGGRMDDEDPFLMVRVRDKDTIFNLF